MKRSAFVTLAAMALLPASASAEALKLPDVLKEVSVNGFVSAGYTYNANEPDSRAVNLRPFNNEHDTFALELAQLVFHKDAVNPGEAGFRLDLNFGYTVPEAIHSAGYNGSDDFDIRQGYLSYVVPIGNGLRIDAGKFITEMGLEVIEGYEDWNWNYSRSLMFYNAIPYTHTGIRAVYPVNEGLTLVGEVVNGWDRVNENNGGKTYCLHAAVTPVEGTTVNLKYMAGPEQDSDVSDLRQIVNVNVSTGLGKVLLKADLLYGSEENVAGIGDAEWSGAAVYARYQYTERFAVNARAEYFKDNDGARTATGQEMWEFTLTPEYAVNENFLVRGEYRHDASDKAVFDEDGGLSKEQDTLGVNAIFHF